MEKIWNQERYNQFFNELNSLKDLKYKSFQANLGIREDYLIGVRTPELKKYAKAISKEDYLTFIQLNTHNTYEERLIHGLLIGYIKTDFKEITKLLWEFIPYIDNWALCDVTIANIRIWNKYTKEGFSFVKRCLKQKNEWYQRVGLILLLDYYINDNYIDQILDICNHFKTDKYYVKMAIAWLISICYIKQKEKTLLFIQNNQMDNWIQNKSIQKIRESTRINKEEKEELLKYKKNSSMRKENK